jgi:hypothetical protein
MTIATLLPRDTALQMISLITSPTVLRSSARDKIPALDGDRVLLMVVQTTQTIDIARGGVGPAAGNLHIPLYMRHPLQLANL